MNCSGCGVELDPSEEQVNSAVDQILETSLKHAERTGGVCPLCGHSKEVPYSQRKSVLFALLAACLVLLGAGALILRQWRQTERASIVSTAIYRMSSNADVVGLMGTPIKAEPGIAGDIRQDETGWKEARLLIPVRGPHGTAQVHVIAGKGSEAWVFTTFEVVFAKEHEKVDLIMGRVIEYDPDAYVNVHYESAVSPEYSNGFVPAARFDGSFPCVAATVDGASVSPQLAKCDMPIMQKGAVDRFETDLRDANFVLQETDLRINDVFDVPLTRSYRSRDWAHSNPVHAFGRNSNHPYDIAPVGTRNPYTWQMLVLEDGEFLYFDRISKGTGYADALYMHTETSTPFYKATQQWNGNGWTMKLADGSQILFPESYNAKNMAQGAAIEMRDAKGNRLELKRDGQRNLQEIRTPHGHWIRFSYDDQSRIMRAETDAGGWARYEYNSGGMLTSAALSSGRERHYEYEGTFMTNVSDEEGHNLVHNWYDRGYLKGQEFGQGTVYSYSFDWSSKSYYPAKVWVTMPDHKRKELSVADSVPEFVRNYHR
jgi:YD repeat-containing protein